MQYLEKRCYKELRRERFRHTKVVIHIYRKLLASCKERMPLFASSLLCIIQALLDQTRQDDMQILGCETLADFIDSQIDNTYMSNIEGFVPKLCQLGQEVGGDERAFRLRSAGLQVLASLVRFIGEYSHVSTEFNNIVSVIIENYEANPGYGTHNQQCTSVQNQLAEKVSRGEGDSSSFRNSLKNVSSLNIRTKVELNDTLKDIARNPAYWSRVCLQNIANLAKEGTTVRRVLEPMFRFFDNGSHWSSEKGFASSILSELQISLEKSGQSSHILLSSLAKHVGHKDVSKKLDMQINIVKVTSTLAMNAGKKVSVPIMTAISDLAQHLRICMQCSIESSNLEDDVNKLNSVLYSALEECLVHLLDKVGDAGPILDMMAVELEKTPKTPILSRTTISSIFRIAQIAASSPNTSYHKKALPENVFHQLLLAMSHPDHVTRVGANRIFSVVLMPNIVCNGPISCIPFSSEGYDPKETRLVALSAFLSSGDILEKIGGKGCSLQHLYLGENEKSYAEAEEIQEECQHVSLDVQQCRVCQYCIELQRIQLSPPCSLDGKIAIGSRREDLSYMRLSGHQVGHLLSSIWTQATSQENMPENYEAIAHTYKLVLLFSQTKISSHTALTRCFQLAFSLWKISLCHESYLQPSCRRSLFTLASSMLIFSATVAELPRISISVKAITDKMVNPHFRLVGDSCLQAVHVACSCGRKIYGSKEDDISALKFLETIESDDQGIEQIVVSSLVNKFKKLPEEELLGIEEKLKREFIPDDTFPLGTPLFINSQNPCLPPAQTETQTLTEVTHTYFEDEDPFPESCGSPSKHIVSDSKVIEIPSADQLIQLVRQTERQVASLPFLPVLVPYDQLKGHCEAFSTEKQQKLSLLFSFKHRQDCLQTVEDASSALQKALKLQEGQSGCCDSLSKTSEKCLRMPLSSPYDRFLKAAGR